VLNAVVLNNKVDIIVALAARGEIDHVDEAFVAGGFCAKMIFD
jgi:hypothetical protein